VTVAVRVIPCLDVDGGRVVKGVNFQNLRDAGDPVEMAKVYDAEGADELVFLDITASSGNRETTYDVVRRTAEQVFIPLTVGGGVRSAEELAGCSKLQPGEDPNTALFSIDVIQVPLSAPQTARIVNRPRIFADPATGVAVFDSTPVGTQSGWLVFGGTSVASPIIASVYGLAGNAATIDANDFPYQHTGSLFDVTSGRNGTCTPTQLCTARAGWDGPTGLGTPNGIGAF